MPYGIRKLPNQDLYRVFNKDTGEIHSKATTKGNALKQIRLLYMVERNKEKAGGAVTSDGSHFKASSLEGQYIRNSYPKEEASMDQDRVSGGCAMCQGTCGSGKYDFEVLKKSKKYKIPEGEMIDDDIQRLLKLQAVNEPTKTLVEDTKSKLDRLIKIGEEQGAKPYNSDFNVETILYLHILEKYINPCAVFTRPDLSNRFLYAGIQIQANLDQTKKDFTKKVLDGLNKVISKCIKDNVDTIVLPLGFSYDDKELIPPAPASKRHGHANIIVIRPKLKTIEHFEPHGSRFMSDQKRYKNVITGLEDSIKYIFNNMKATKDFVVGTPDEICPNTNGIQSYESVIKKQRFEGGGYCAMWAMLFLEMVLLNPTLSSKQINDLLLEKVGNNSDIALALVRGYVAEAQSTIDELIKRLTGGTFEFKTQEELSDIAKSLKFNGEYTIGNLLRRDGKKKALEDWALNLLFRIDKKKQYLEKGEPKPKGRPKGSKMSDAKKAEREAKKRAEWQMKRKAPPEVQEVLGFHEPLAKKTFMPPYQPQGNYMTPWRWVLYKEKELQNTTYPNVMKQPAVKNLYYKLKDQAGEDFSVDWLEANYMKKRKGISSEKPPAKKKQPEKPKGKPITDFFKKTSEEIEEEL